MGKGRIRMQQRTQRVAVGAMILGMLLAGCSGQPATSPSGAEKAPAAVGPNGGTVSVRLIADWDNLDPAKTRNVYGMQMVLAFYDRLVALDSDGKVVPSLAESWTATANSATFKLKQGVSCADGTALTPTIVADSLKRLGAPETKAPLASRTFGKSGFTVTADDSASTVTVQTVDPIDLITQMTAPWTAVVCPAGLKNPDALASTPAGTGPFTLEKAVRGDSYTLAARKEYAWGPFGAKATDPGYPEKVVFRLVDNETTAANLLTTGDLDVGLVTGIDYQRVASDSALARTDKETFGIHYLLFNQAPGRVMADPVVRMALSLAVDSEAFNKAAHFGRGKVASSFGSDKISCYDPATKSLVAGFDLPKAQALLDQAGWKMGSDGVRTKDGKPLEIIFVGGNLTNSGPEYVAEAFRKLGVSVKVAAGDANAQMERLFETNDFDVSIDSVLPLQPTFDAGASYLVGEGPPKGNNIGNIQNAAFAEAVAAATKAEPDQRCGYWSGAQKALLTSADIKPLTYEVVSWFGRGVAFKLEHTHLIEPSSIRRTK